MKKSMWLLPLVLSACFPVVLPISNPAQAEPNIYGQWRIQEVAAHKPSLDSVFVLNSSNSGFSVSSACTELRGTYAVTEGQSLVFGNMQGADKACDSEYKAEQRLAQILSSVQTYRFNNRDLVLLDANGAAVFVGTRLSRASAQSQSGQGTAFLKDARRN